MTRIELIYDAKRGLHVEHDGELSLAELMEVAGALALIVATNLYEFEGTAGVEEWLKTYRNVVRQFLEEYANGRLRGGTRIDRLPKHRERSGP